MAFLALSPLWTFSLSCCMFTEHRAVAPGPAGAGMCRWFIAQSRSCAVQTGGAIYSLFWGWMLPFSSHSLIFSWRISSNLERPYPQSWKIPAEFFQIHLGWKHKAAACVKCSFFSCRDLEQWHHFTGEGPEKEPDRICSRWEGPFLSLRGGVK